MLGFDKIPFLAFPWIFLTSHDFGGILTLYSSLLACYSPTIFILKTISYYGSSEVFVYYSIYFLKKSLSILYPSSSLQTSVCQKKKIRGRINKSGKMFLVKLKPKVKN